ncbi:hypothetical protein CFP56_004945, partial [Quercus suber]
HSRAQTQQKTATHHRGTKTLNPKPRNSFSSFFTDEFRPRRRQIPQTQNHETPPKKKKKNKHKTPQPPPQPPSPPPPSPPVQAKVQSFKENPKKFPPFVAYFPSGYDPTKNLNNSEQIDGHESAPSVKVYRSQERPQRVEMVYVIVDSSRMFAIVKVFRLEPKVRGLEAADKKTESPVKEELSAVKKADRFRELTNLYGTKKARNETGIVLDVDGNTTLVVKTVLLKEERRAEV